jgi:hypothetical protein
MSTQWRCTTVAIPEPRRSRIVERQRRHLDGRATAAERAAERSRTPGQQRAAAVSWPLVARARARGRPRHAGVAPRCRPPSLRASVAKILCPVPVANRMPLTREWRQVQLTLNSRRRRRMEGGGWRPGAGRTRNGGRAERARPRGPVRIAYRCRRRRSACRRRRSIPPRVSALDINPDQLRRPTRSSRRRGAPGEALRGGGHDPPRGHRGVVSPCPYGRTLTLPPRRWPQ